MCDTAPHGATKRVQTLFGKIVLFVIIGGKLTSLITVQIFQIPSTQKRSTRGTFQQKNRRF